MKARASEHVLSAPVIPEPSTQDEFYERAALEYAAALARLVRAYEDDEHLRHDLLQDIHLTLWKSFASYDRRCSLRTWTYRVAHNVATTHVIRGRRRRTREYVALEEIEELPDAQDTVRMLDETRVLEHVRALIKRLAPIDQQTILLYLEGVTAAQIAEIVGISAQNAATKVHRIKRILTNSINSGDVS
jgi:RNA polymerase sigma-70 factor, ECF subfamily